MSAAQKCAPSLAVMIAAGGMHDDVLALAKSFGVRPVHLDQLAVPEEQDASRKLLMQMLKDAR
jgi:hypothetical protein